MRRSLTERSSPGNESSHGGTLYDNGSRICALVLAICETADALPGESAFVVSGVPRSHLAPLHVSGSRRGSRSAPALDGRSTPMLSSVAAGDPAEARPRSLRDCDSEHCALRLHVGF
jgi:hypothetical protein